MMRAIDADALMPKLKFIREAEHQIYGKESWGFASKCITAIEDAPTIEPERKNGKWIKEHWHSDHVRQCSACHVTQTVTTYRGVVNFKFCPYCGVDMRGGA